MTELQTQLFDYSVLDIETREFVKTQANEARFFLNRTIEDAIEVGKRFIAVRDKLKHNKNGGFESWVKTEFDMSRWTAYQFINLAENLNCVNFTQLDISKSVAYLLAAPSTPESAREEVIEKAKNGYQGPYRPDDH